MARPTIADLSSLTDPHEQEYVKAKRGLVPDDQLVDDLEQFRAIRAADARGASEDVDEPTARAVSAALTSDAPEEPEDPHFAAFLKEAKELNPDYSDEQIREVYDRAIAEKDQDLLSYENFAEQAKPMNPDYSDEEIRAIWEEQYGSRGAQEKDPGFAGTLLEGVKQTGRSLKAFGQALTGDSTGAEETAAASASAPRDPALVRLLRDINARKEELGPDASWFDAGAAVGKAMLANPKGSALLLTEQLPNSAAALGSAGLGAVAGSAFGPVGTVIGGLAGLFAADVALETGGKVIEKAEGGLEPTERMEALEEGLKKGSIVAAIDAATFGGTKWLTGAASRAVERATVKTLEREGVDVSDRTAIDAARQSPDIVEKVQAAQKEALQHVNSLGQKTARGTTEVGLETLGEGAGEYIGELVATGHGDKVEAFIEAFSGMGQSLGEIGVAGALGKAGQKTELFNKTHDVDRPEIKNILNQETLDDAIKAAGDAISGETPDITPEKIDAFLGENTSKAEDYTDSHFNADQSIANQMFATLKEQGYKVSTDADSTMSFRGITSRVIRPTELPDDPGPGNNRITKGQYEAIEVALQAMGKHLIVLDGPMPTFEGAVMSSLLPTTVFISNNTTHDPVAVAFHEVGHLMQGGQLYTAFQDTVKENLRLNWRKEALERGHSPKSNLLNEVSSDILGNAMTSPQFMSKVFKNLQEQVGLEQAHQEAQGFLDKIKEVIARITNAISRHAFKTANGRDVAEAYVKNLEAVHDSLAKAVAAEYRKHGIAGVSTQPVNETVAQEDVRRANEERVILDPQIARTFQNISEVDYPQGPIKAVGDTAGPGVIGNVTRRVGNVLHGLTSLATDGTVAKEKVKADVNAAINILTNPYGFDRETIENIVGHARKTKQDPTKFANSISTSLRKYAQSFGAINVYNRPQWLAKHAAIAIGERKWQIATGYLTELRKMLDSDTFTKDALNYKTDAENKPAFYARPIKAKMISVTPSGDIRIKDGWGDREYHLEEPLGNIPAGSKISGMELEKLGYRPDVTDIITHEEDKAARKKVEQDAKGAKKKKDLKPTEKKDLKPKEEKREEGKQKEKVLESDGATIDAEAKLVDPDPTDGQKEAGNYKKGHITINGMEISIENPEGGTRSGTDRSGKPWSITMKSHYGYIRGTKGRDKEHLDVYVKPGTSENFDGIVYVVDQIVPDTKSFDEHKVLIGASSLDDAKRMYLENYTKGWKGLGAISPMPMDRFKEWIKGDTTQPVAYKPKKDLVPTKKAEPVAATPKKDLVPTKKEVATADGTASGFLDTPLPAEEKPAVKAPTSTNRSYEEIAKEIFEREGELWDQGMDVTKMYNPLDPRDKVLAKRKGYEPMPDDLAKLHMERELVQIVQKNQPQFARVIPPVPYTVSQPGFLDKWRRKLQDKNIDIAAFVDSIKLAGGRVPSDVNPVLREEMYAKRAEIRSEDFKNQELVPLIDHMREHKISLESLNKYAHARHVITDRVNARLKDLNPDMPNNEALSGMTDGEAQKTLKTLGSPAMQEAMRRMDAMIEKTRDLMVEYGLERESLIKEWRAQYKAYVPLRREAFEEEGHPTGTGRSVRGSSAQDRLGSNLEVGDILSNIAQARDQIISRGEKMRPVTAMAALLMLHPNKEIAVLDKPATITMTDPETGLTTSVPGDLANYKMPKIRRRDPKTGEVKWYPDPSYKGHENVVNFRVKGVDYAIVFNEKNERAREMAKAFRDVDTGQLTGLLKAVAPYTRYLASINTQYNPIFGMVNFVRDSQFAMLTLGSTPLAGRQAEVLKNAVTSLKGIFQDARDSRHGLPPSSATAQMWERFQHVGGPTGYRDLFFTASDRANEIRRLLEPNTWKHIKSPQDFGRRVEETFLFKLLSDYNLTMENSIRLGVFKTAVDMGIDDLQAASYAKNITVNFNKKGQMGAQLGAAYAFFNANIQGTTRIFETLWTKEKDGYRLSSVGKKIITGGLLVGILQTSLLALSGFGDDEPPEFVKEKNFVIPVPGTDKGYIMIPMPLGFNLLPNIGRVASEVSFALMKGDDPKLFQRFADMFHNVLSALSPTGGTGSAALELTPTIADPLLSLEMNKDWTGKKISKEDFSSLKATPGHTRARDSATPWAMGLSKFINWATGGTDYTPGVWSPTPDAIDYLVQQATGGVGREFSKAAQVVKSAESGEELPTYKYPVLGRFFGSASGSAGVRDKFYDNIRAVNLAAEEVKGRALHHEERADFLKDHPEARFEKAAVQIQRAIGELQDAKRLAIDRGDSKDSIKLREERITALMKQFNTAVENAKKGGLR